MNEFKKRYNELLRREGKGRAYLDNASIPLQEREKWANEYNSICTKLSAMMSVYEAHTGIAMTDEECLEGFK